MIPNTSRDFGTSMDLLLHAASSAGSDVETVTSSGSPAFATGTPMNAHRPLQPQPKLARLDTAPANPNISAAVPTNHDLHNHSHQSRYANTANTLDHVQERNKLPSLLECGLLMRTGQYSQGPPTLQGSSRISIPALLNGLPPALQTLRAQVVRQVYEYASKPISMTGRSMSAAHAAFASASHPHSHSLANSANSSPNSANRHHMSAPSSASSSSTGMHVCGHVGCGKAFPSRSRLQRHLIVHTNEKPFMCPQEGCGRRFSRRDNMLQHYKSHKVSRRH